MSNQVRIGGVSIDGRVWIAPMTGVSDLPFRRAASRLGAPYVATEMVACAAFAAGRPDVVRRAAVGEGLPRMVVQLVGRAPEDMAAGARLAAAAGADIIDLNFGCPAREVTGGALAGSALMREPDLLFRLIDAVVEAVDTPVTRKMRRGWDDASRNAPEIAAGAEAFITGEISEPQAHYAREMGVSFIACGHHASERYGAPAVAAQVAAELGLVHEFIDIPNPA